VPATQLAVDTFMADKTVLNLTRAICRRFRKLRAGLRGQNSLIGDMDLFIAGTCLGHNLALLITNRKRFERIPGISITSEPSDVQRRSATPGCPDGGGALVVHLCAGEYST